MAQATKKAVNNNKFKVNLSDTQRWIIGVVLFVFAVFLFAAVVSYYFCWADDQNFVRWVDMKAPGDVANPAGKVGAVFANYIVGEWFGIFGLVIPIMLIILAVRIINIRPAFLRKSIRISLLTMIFGSLSLGFVFGTSWGVFGSGLGGAHGIVVAHWISGYLGTVGTALLLILCWILLGVYVSRRTISVVNKVGKGIYDSSLRMGEAVIDHVNKGAREDAQKESEQETDNVAPWEYDTPENNAAEPVKNENPDKDEKPVKETFTVVSHEAEDDDRHETYEHIVGKPVTTINDLYGHGGGHFEILDARRGSDEIEVMDTAPNREVSHKTTESKVVTLGEDAGDFIIHTAGASVADDFDNSRYAGGVGRYAASLDDRQNKTNDKKEVVEVRQTSDGSVFEVIERGSGPISVGGVVESVSANGGVSADDKLEVVVAERHDVMLSEDEIEDTLYDPTLELSKYQKPPVEILEDHSIDVQVTEEEIYQNKNQIVRTLENFGIKIDKIKATIGPTVTLYEIVPSAGVKISKIKNLEDDIALSLKALGIRIIAPMPGKGTVGIEVPNKDKEIVSMYSLVRTKKFQESGYELPVVLGKTISNEVFMIDLAKMPHLLVAGATGQGKSVGLNAIITSLLYKKHPGELKFVMVDPKRVELSLYGKLEKHFLAKMESEDDAILTDTQKVVYTLNALCKEMTDRYDLLRMAEVKKISEYNDKFRRRRLNPKKGHRFMPYIVVVIDEFADMIMTAGREIEAPITRLAQLARAVGIHLVIATQRPDVKVITGLIKANFPARIAFRVMSMVDSRTIIDQPGANQLIGRGDMLMSLNGELTRVQCAFIDTPEIERITEFISNQKGYTSAYLLPDYVPESEAAQSKNVDLGQIDPMFEDVARFVVQNQQGSTSSIQRRFSIGYNRAGRIMDQLEAYGIVGKAEGSKPREVLIMDMLSLEHIINHMDE